MSDFLFSEFNPVSAKQWKQKIQMELKGADYNHTLIWQSLEGVHVRPFYHRDDCTDGFPSIPGTPSQWKIMQQVYLDDAVISHKLIKDALNKGAEGVYLTARETFDYTEIFKDFPFEVADIYFSLQFSDADFMKKLTRFFQINNAKVYYNIDIIHHLASEGNWFQSLEKDHDHLDEIIKHNPGENILGIHTSLYQNAGANIVQQLAYSLAHANEYLNHCNGKKDFDQIKLTFILSLGSNYFFEIAKIRALRLLYATLAEAYGISQECNILTLPSKRNKTLYDYNVNMLRTTTECMSAALGGANAICNLPYDVLYHKSNDFGERISRNQLIMMKAESYLGYTSNPADGSYYIESLTKELSEKALHLFKEIEKGGGFLKQLKEGILQKKIKESSKKEQEWFDLGKLVLLGTNKYPNPNDRMVEELELYPFLKTKPRKTLIEPIFEKRLAETLEKERLENEKK
jgi:methylmalonyl-CoA mutase